MDHNLFVGIFVQLHIPYRQSSQRLAMIAVSKRNEVRLGLAFVFEVVKAHLQGYLNSAAAIVGIETLLHARESTHPLTQSYNLLMGKTGKNHVLQRL